MMLIVNPMATTVSGRLKNLVVYALRGRYEVDAVETEARGHAVELTREAAQRGYDLVVAFGGDGTVNEAANGLAGSPVPLSVLPGGCTNVVCRVIGISNDVIDATEHLLAMADALQPRPIDLGSVNGRYFVSSSGIGLDADTTRWVDRRSTLKSHAGPFFFAGASMASFLSRYAFRPPKLIVEAGGERIEGVTAIVQNSDPYTYFGTRPVRVCRDVTLESGTLSMTVLTRARLADVPAFTAKLLSGRERLAHHPTIRSLAGLRAGRVVALERERAPVPFPLQVDGDHIGDFTEAAFDVRPRALLIAT
jgi:diacylglycerol kinase family enzyme